MAVTRNDILDALRGRESRIESGDWRRMVEMYPYCEIFVWHYLRALYRADDVLFESELQRLGVRLGDKQEFYTFMIRRAENETLFSYRTETTDYFARKGQEGLSLTELARKLRSARMAEKETRETSFCTEGEKKNDIQQPSEESVGEKIRQSDYTRSGQKEQRNQSEVSDGGIVDSVQNIDNLQDIKARITELIVRKKYSEALEILKRENFANSKKNAYFAVQIKYLETIINNQ